MSKNSKNKLQELFQYNQLPLPTYICERRGGNDHAPLWTSIVTLHDGRQFEGNVSTNKAQADISAADIALLHINSNQATPITKRICTDGSYENYQFNLLASLKISEPTTIGKCAILVDVENLPRFIESISDKLPNFTVYAFIGEHHCLSHKEFPLGVIKILSPSTRSDGTDSCMQVYTGMLLTQEAYDNYIIVTRDHFGSTLVEMISSKGLGWVPKKARLVTNPSQL